jgi:AbrB family looped-hinge helix DNA binding protein
MLRGVRRVAVRRAVHEQWNAERREREQRHDVSDVAVARRRPVRELEGSAAPRISAVASASRYGLKDGKYWGVLSGIFVTMITTMDRAGRLVIPRAIRRDAGLEPDTPLDVRWRDGVIEIEPAPMQVTLGRKGRLVVARPATAAPPLKAAAVERTRQSLRRKP